ncbi:hypothetical protein H6P81_016787 [Aristolochia fimbriata]|uniref:Uncharacterized protein n=1 Tax=Aristolochia fimbriata TaxID=158543 RepID=A0AAV7E9B2_ARIFI|nr:hypothetical protein H6P81_016787 [Aristolochia fimbriata]
MGNSLRCCLACVLPCGALDVIRIVHINGQVEELSRAISAGEILKANPNHVLTKPTSQGMVHRILILSPESELKRGHIYFLIPSSSVPEKKKTKSHKNRGDRVTGNANTTTTTTTITTTVAHKKSTCTSTTTVVSNYNKPTAAGNQPEILSNDHYLKEILSEKKSSRRDRRSKPGDLRLREAAKGDQSVHYFIEPRAILRNEREEPRRMPRSRGSLPARSGTRQGPHFDGREEWGNGKQYKLPH